MKTPIMQFGTSRFLQAHADLFVSEALAKGEALGPITVVQTTDSSDRAGRLIGLAAEEGFPVVIRGLDGGQQIDRRIQVKSVARALSANRDWQEVTRIFVEEVEIVICNTADQGYDISGEGAEAPQGVPVSFPGKLLALLRTRFLSTKAGLTVLPCELVTDNGTVLAGIVTLLARRWYQDAAFDAWLSEAVLFCNTLVDRIVSQALSPAGAVAEPYALWAIARVHGQSLPCTHSSIAIADDIAPFAQLKLFILNLGHTMLADRWIEQRLPEMLTVREILASGTAKDELMQIYDSEVLAGFAAKGMRDSASSYIATTMERFENPFLDHRLSDIAQNHDQKVQRRLAGFLAWSGISAPALERMIAARS